MSTLLRFSCSGKPFPNFLNPKDYTKRPVFRSAHSYLNAYPASTQYSNWKKVFAHCGSYCSKVTHVCHGQIQQELSDRGVCAQDSERFFGYAASGGKKIPIKRIRTYSPPLLHLFVVLPMEIPRIRLFTSPPGLSNLVKVNCWIYVLGYILSSIR
jgi:hypothetical protein